MPQRFLKPGIVSSKKWDGLPWPSQSFYIRLITLVDDYGRYLAEPVLLKNQCFPLREDIRTPQVLSMCHDLAEVQLAVFYKVDGKVYVELTNWTERKRSPQSHYPAPSQGEILYGSRPLPSAAIRSEPQPPKSESESSSKPEPESKSESKHSPASESQSPPPCSQSADRPDWDEVLCEAQRIGLAPWKAEDWFHEMEGCGWLDYNRRPVMKWRPVLTRVCRKWEADGRPMQPRSYPNTGKQGAASPLWAQEKALAQVIEQKKKDLPGVADPNLYPEQNAKDVEKRKPLVAELKELRGQLNQLRERVAKGEQ
jgi:hypothetical protein